MNIWISWLFLLTTFKSTFSLTNNCSNEIIVHLVNGEVRGTTLKSIEGKEYYAFLGIPYAEPPVGELRFKAPIPKRPWSDKGIFDARKDGAVCIQINFISKSVTGSEDCLFINVYTPQYVSSSKYPVMVFIHGGAFRFGESSSWMYGPGKFITEEIVVVSLSYRLDALGFLSTNDDASPGNYGFLDQVEALKWVKENIGAFGGDSNQVTLVGHSAGSTSTLYHLMSPLSRGLFQRSIALSGPILCPWSFTSKPQHWAKKLGKALNCPENHYELVNCLRKVPAKDLLKATQPFSLQVMIPFPPVADGSFLSRNPKDAFQNGDILNKVPIITGIVKNEGIGVYGLANPKYKTCSDDMFKRFIRGALNDDRDIPSIAELVKEKYLQNVGSSGDPLSRVTAMSKFLGDAIVDVCHFETVKRLANAGLETYTYSFDFAANYSYLSLLGIKDYLGVAHGDDLWMLFDGAVFNSFMRNERIKQMAKRLVHLYSNFVKSGDATQDFEVKWPQSLPGDIRVYHIDEVNSVNNYNPDDHPRTELWLKTIPQLINNIPQEKNEL